MISSASVLKVFDSSEEAVLQCNASKHGLMSYAEWVACGLHIAFADNCRT